MELCLLSLSLSLSLVHLNKLKYHFELNKKMKLILNKFIEGTGRSVVGVSLAMQKARV